MKTSENIQAERLDALGVHAAGMAHELNNPLTGVLNFIQYCIKHTDQGDKKFEVLKDAEREVKRCIMIVKNLLIFAHGGLKLTEPVEEELLSVIFERVSLLLSYRISKENVEVIKNFPNNMPKVPLQINKIQQVLLNLVTNALDALKNSTIKKIIVTEETKGNMEVLTIEDTGCGIEPEKLTKLFEAFYTVKETGLGLGLFVVKQIIDEHNGKLNCESHVGKGTKFIVKLPLK